MQIINHKAHFKTLHAKLGFAVSILVFVVAAGGLVSFRKLGMLHYVPDRWQATIKASHRYVSTLTHASAQLNTRSGSGHRQDQAGGSLLCMWRSRLFLDQRAWSCLVT